MSTNDIDYIVLRNNETGIKHLMHIHGEGVVEKTVCGMTLANHKLFHDTIKMGSFWKSKNKCKHCVLAAKR